MKGRTVALEVFDKCFDEGRSGLSVDKTVSNVYFLCKFRSGGKEIIDGRCLTCD